jgi:defect-in-organelle-trafficking protein DotC
MKYFIPFIAVLLLVFSMPASAQYDEVNKQRPETLDELLDLPRKNSFSADTSSMLPDIRIEAQKEAAYSYGARGGLAWRTWHIRNEMESRARYLDKVFDFRQLLIPAPSGLLIEPPVISEAMDATLIDSRGMEAAVADRVLNIGQNARIVSVPRTWRVYLEREWGEIDPPPDILLPENPEERKAWEENVKRGWEMGVSQADDIFQADLNRLVADYQGMIRYRSLLARGMVTPPYALQVDRGVTGGGDNMRIGDRALSLTELPKLQTGYQEWQPANR